MKLTKSGVGIYFHKNTELLKLKFNISLTFQGFMSLRKSTNSKYVENLITGAHAENW